MKKIVLGLFTLILICSSLSAQNPTAAKDSIKLTADFCKELNAIISVMNKGEIGKIVDSTEHYGDFHLTYKGTAKIAGLMNFVGEEKNNVLMYSGYLDVEMKSKNAAKEFLKRTYACLGDSFSYSMAGTVVVFTSKANPALKVSVDSFFGYGAFIKLIVSLDK